MKNCFCLLLVDNGSPPAELKSLGIFLNQERCGKGATCEETIRGFNCLCLPGFERLDDFTCIDTDECAAENDCSPDATCTNTEGSYECSCPEGFEVIFLSCL